MKRIFLFLVTNLALLALLSVVVFIIEQVFARRNAARVAVSTGLLRSTSRPRIEAVLGHEISHVANGDMVTLALLQGVLNTFVIFLARIIGNIVDRALFKNDREQSAAAR
jgi:heat shock protein HtpX